MTDIHSHILPGVDDGSQSMEESLDLLAIAADSGVTGIVSTNHCNIPGEFDNYASRELLRLWERLCDEARRAEIPIRIYRGMEIYATGDLPELLQNGRVWTLNGTRYFLTEFGFGEDPDFCRDVLRRCSELGYRPIIAHPERYFFVQANPEIAFEWCTSGYGLQVNKGSLLGRFGRGPKFAADLILSHGLCACVGSDAHNPNQRSTYMGEVRRYLIDEYGESYAHLLLTENPSRILSGKELLGYEPIPF